MCFSLILFLHDCQAGITIPAFLNLETIISGLFIYVIVILYKEYANGVIYYFDVNPQRVFTRKQRTVF